MSLTKTRFLARLGPLLLLTACAGGETGGGPGVAVDSVAGVEVVTNLAGAATAERVAVRLGEEPLRIGRIEGDGPEVFGEIAAVAVGPDRTVYVADAVAMEVRAFGPDGAFRLAFGREGEGPGEFAHIDGLIVEPGGEIVVRDPQLPRVSRFAPDGTFLDSFRLERPFFIFSDGTTFWGDSAGRLYDWSLLDSSISEIDRYGLIIYEDGGSPDTLEVVEVRRPRLVATQGERTVLSLVAPFSPFPQMAVSASGRIAAGVGDAYRFTIMDPAGDTLRAFAREVEPTPVASSEEEAELERLRARAEEMAPGARLGEAVFPSHKPVVSRLLADASGNWWVGRYRGEADPGDPAATFPVRYDVFDADGRLLGYVDVPPMRIHQIGEDYLAGVVYDELGVAYAVVYDLIRDDG